MREIESKSSYKTSRYRGRVKYMEIFTCISLFCSSNYLVAFRRNALLVSGISWRIWRFLFSGFLRRGRRLQHKPIFMCFFMRFFWSFLITFSFSQLGLGSTLQRNFQRFTSFISVDSIWVLYFWAFELIMFKVVVNMGLF